MANQFDKSKDFELYSQMMPNGTIKVSVKSYNYYPPKIDISRIDKMNPNEFRQSGRLTPEEAQFVFQVLPDILNKYPSIAASVDAMKNSQQAANNYKNNSYNQFNPGSNDGPF